MALPYICPACTAPLQETVQDKYDPETVKITKLASSLPRVCRFPQRIGNATLEQDFIKKMLVAKSLKVRSLPWA
jgi:hypothetical protein